MITKFWDVLFDKNERTCFTSDVYGTTIYTPYMDNYGETMNLQFFCINPLMIMRKDSSVTSFRNILIEIDKMPIGMQELYIDRIGMPYSTCTFSGNKSMHFIISLEEPCKDIKEYKALVKRVLDKVEYADKSTSNPSRLSRTPKAIRDNGNLQSLLSVGRRITREELEKFIGPDLKSEEHNPIVKMPKQTGENRRRILPVRVLAFMEYGAEEGGRNRALFTNACELFRANYEADEIFEIAKRVLDLPASEMRQCIESARKTVQNE